MLDVQFFIFSNKIKEKSFVMKNVSTEKHFYFKYKQFLNVTSNCFSYINDIPISHQQNVLTFPNSQHLHLHCHNCLEATKFCHKSQSITPDSINKATTTYPYLCMAEDTHVICCFMPSCCSTVMQYSSLFINVCFDVQSFATRH